MQYHIPTSGPGPAVHSQAIQPGTVPVAQLSFLFDYNGVLVDDEDVHLAAFRDVLHPLGITLSDQDYNARYLGFDDVGAFRAILQDHHQPASDARIAELVQAKKPLYLARAQQQLKLFEGAGALLTRLARRGAIIGVVSGALRAEIELGLERLGATDAVRFIVSAEDTQACKPDPEGYLIGKRKLAELALQTPHTVVIEDSLAGIAAARAADLPCIAVAHSYPEAELQAAGATRVVPRIADITEQLLLELAPLAHA